MVRSQSWPTTPSGTFAIADLPPGRYVLRSRADGCPGGPKAALATGNHVVSTLGGSVEGLELVARPVGRLLLRCAEDDPRDLVFEALDAGGLPRASGSLWKDGARLVDLPHGRYRLRVVDGDGEEVIEREVDVGEEPIAVDVPPSGEGR